MLDDKWDWRFLALASHVAQWSKDPTTKVGAVIVRPDRTISSLGYNGFPRGVKDSRGYLENRQMKLDRTIHAELNAILSSHVPLHGQTLYCTLPCCCRCAAHIIQVGIKRVVWYPDTPIEFTQRWSGEIGSAISMFIEAGVEVHTPKQNRME